MKQISYNDRVVGTIIMRYNSDTFSDRIRIGVVEDHANGARFTQVLKVYYTTMLENQLIWVRCRNDGNMLAYGNLITFELTPEEANAILIEEI